MVQPSGKYRHRVLCRVLSVKVIEFVISGSELYFVLWALIDVVCRSVLVGYLSIMGTTTTSSCNRSLHLHLFARVA